MSKSQVQSFREYPGHMELSEFTNRDEEELDIPIERQEYRPRQRATQTLRHIVPEQLEEDIPDELLDLMLQGPENTARLRQADPEVFAPGFARIVQRDRQPIVFTASQIRILDRLRPHILSNILEYRGNYYVAPFESDMEVRLKTPPKSSGLSLPIPALFSKRGRSPPIFRHGEMSRDELPSIGESFRRWDNLSKVRRSPSPKPRGRSPPRSPPRPRL